MHNQLKHQILQRNNKNKETIADNSTFINSANEIPPLNGRLDASITTTRSPTATIGILVTNNTNNCDTQNNPSNPQESHVGKSTSYLTATPNLVASTSANNQ